MNRDEAVAQARRAMEKGVTESEIRDQLRRAGIIGGAADGVVQEAYRGRLKLRGRRSLEFDRRQLILFTLGVACIALSPIAGAPWSMFGGFNFNAMIVIGIGVSLMLGAVALRPQLK